MKMGPSSVPSIDRLMRSPALADLPHSIRKLAARAAAERLRAGESGNPELIAQAIAKSLMQLHVRPAINMSGVLLHTGLGRARLAPEVALAIASVGFSHSTLELDLETGGRGQRQTRVESQLQHLTGCERACAVNNCASALVVSLMAMATESRCVILSRGEMVEIGGSFRMPEIIEATGLKLVEVGCTNKTNLSDYSKALKKHRGAILRCSPSNFAISGFTSRPSLPALAEIAREFQVPLINDMGSGCLVDTTRFGLGKAETLRDSVMAGVDLAIGSGDKLLGGPQAGMIVGTHSAVATVLQHPMYRAMRPDKLTLVGLESTLQMVLEGRETEIPTWAALSLSVDAVRVRAKKLAKSFGKAASVQPSIFEIGGGSLAGQVIPSAVAVLNTAQPDRLCARLRNQPTPIVSRVKNGAVWLDPRTANAEEIRYACNVLREVSNDF